MFEIATQNSYEPRRKRSDISAYLENNPFPNDLPVYLPNALRDLWEFIGEQKPYILSENLAKALQKYLINMHRQDKVADPQELNKYATKVNLQFLFAQIDNILAKYAGLELNKLPAYKDSKKFNDALKDALLSDVTDKALKLLDNLNPVYMPGGPGVNVFKEGKEFEERKEAVELAIKDALNAILDKLQNGQIVYENDEILKELIRKFQDNKIYIDNTSKLFADRLLARVYAVLGNKLHEQQAQNADAERVAAKEKSQGESSKKPHAKRRAGARSAKPNDKPHNNESIFNRQSNFLEYSVSLAAQLTNKEAQRQGVTDLKEKKQLYKKILKALQEREGKYENPREMRQDILKQYEKDNDYVQQLIGKAVKPQVADQRPPTSGVETKESIGDMALEKPLAKEELKTTKHILLEDLNKEKPELFTKQFAKNQKLKEVYKQAIQYITNNPSLANDEKTCAELAQSLQKFAESKNTKNSKGNLYAKRTFVSIAKDVQQAFKKVKKLLAQKFARKDDSKPKEGSVTNERIPQKTKTLWQKLKRYVKVIFFGAFLSAVPASQTSDIDTINTNAASKPVSELVCKSLYTPQEVLAQYKFFLSLGASAKPHGALLDKTHAMAKIAQQIKTNREHIKALEEKLQHLQKQLNERASQSDLKQIQANIIRLYKKQQDLTSTLQGVLKELNKRVEIKKTEAPAKPVSSESFMAEPKVKLKEKYALSIEYIIQKNDSLIKVLKHKFGIERKMQERGLSYTKRRQVFALLRLALNNLFEHNILDYKKFGFYKNGADYILQGDTLSLSKLFSAQLQTGGGKTSLLDFVFNTKTAQAFRMYQLNKNDLQTVKYIFEEILS